MDLAIGPSKIAFLSAENGLRGWKLKDLIAQHPRSAVASFEVGGVLRMLSTLRLIDGTTYNLECGRLVAGKVKRVKRELGT